MKMKRKKNTRKTSKNCIHTKAKKDARAILRYLVKIGFNPWRANEFSRPLGVLIRMIDDHLKETKNA